MNVALLSLQHSRYDYYPSGLSVKLSERLISIRIGLKGNVFVCKMLIVYV